MHLCCLFYTWILKLQLRMAWIFMDSQTGNDKFWHFLRFQKLASVFFHKFEQKYLKHWKITKFSVRKSMNIHRILQFGSKYVTPHRLWRCSQKIGFKSFFCSHFCWHLLSNKHIYRPRHWIRLKISFNLIPLDSRLGQKSEF